MSSSRKVYISTINDETLPIFIKMFLQIKKKNLAFIKHHLQVKFLFQQLVKNFTNICLNNSTFMQKYIYRLFKNIYCEKSSDFDNHCTFQQFLEKLYMWKKIYIYMWKKIAHKYQPWKIHILTISHEFCQLFCKITYLWRGKE